MNLRTISSYALSVLVVLLVITGCESMGGVFEDAAMDLATDSVSESSSVTSSGSGSGTLDFKEGELLAAYDGSSWEDANYLVATTLTQATESSKNEGEFLFVESGSSRWTPWFYDSYIPSQDELSVGRKVFYCNQGRADYGPMTQDSYRSSWWSVGRITETDELYKGVVKINGDPYKIEAVRLPEQPFE